LKVLITGSSGFIGRHLVVEFENNGYEVVKCDINATDDSIVIMDIMDYSDVLDKIQTYQPDVIVNMAGQANVGLSWIKPQLTFQLNTVGFINIAEAVYQINPNIKIVAMGSSDEYGSLKEQGVDVSEDVPINPMNPYAISKQSQELMAQLYVDNRGMNICMIRQFNLGGAGQSKGFMISDFASGIVEIEMGKKEYLSVGNLESARDFSHVKDACRAIRLIVEKGHAGEVYNICSGKTYKAQEVLDKLISMSKTSVEIRQDSSRMRPSDTPVICGNHDKLTDHTGWVPELQMENILFDSLEYWRNNS
jgi:GDP-4-dehydro-6-deoxy-D-mannose reductase